MESHNEHWMCEEVGAGHGQEQERDKDCSLSQDIDKNVPNHGKWMCVLRFMGSQRVGHG